MPQTDHDRERKFQIQLRIQIPDSCSEDTLHKSLKKKLMSSFSNTPLFQVNVQGLGTQMWILNAKLDNGALSTTSALRKKFRSPVQQAFEECLSPPDYASFIASFCKQGNNNRDFLKITADSDGPFPGPSHFWTDDGAVLPEFTSAIVDALFPEHGAASGGAGPASSSMASTVCGVKIHLRLPIPEGCNQIDIYNDLKRDVQELYAGATWFQVNFQGLGTQLWSMAARLNIGSNMLLRNYRTKFRKPILQSFKSHLAPMQHQIFETRFNRDKGCFKSRRTMLLSPEQTIIHGRWMESPNPATSTWTRQVAVGSPCLRRTPWASLRSTRAACLTAWTLRWLVGPSLPALDLQPPRAARPPAPPHWLPVNPRRRRALQRRRRRQRRLKRLRGGHPVRRRPRRR